ncbi:zinc finger protein 862-like [Pseudophryne corroboree]|uniref:zinc finger protein 862-like n=1 Tax=Pseudophryne corroboree TaxID=495146 RepID=UPI003081CB19
MPTLKRKVKEHERKNKEIGKKCLKINQMFSGKKKKINAAELDPVPSTSDPVPSTSDPVPSTSDPVPTDNQCTSQDNSLATVNTNCSNVDDSVSTSCNVIVNENTIDVHSQSSISLANCSQNLECDTSPPIILDDDLSEERCSSNEDTDIINDIGVSASPKKKSKHKVGFQIKWKREFPWLSCKKNGERESLLCKLCLKHLLNDTKYNKSPWMNSGMSTVRRDKIKEHSVSEMHKAAMQTEIIGCNAEASQNRKNRPESEEFKAVECAMKCLDFLIQHNIPHTTVFKPFVVFCIEELKSPVLAPLNKSKNASYTSYQTINEFVNSMASVQREKVILSLQKSPSFSVMSDETTDVSNRKHLATAAKYIKDGEVSVSFINDTEIPDGKSETIFNALSQTIEDCGGFEKLVGFGSDGASSMVGHRDGVAAKLKAKNNKIISIHCHNHRLALATKNTFESLNPFLKMDEVLTSIYKYYKYSSVRSKTLEEIQRVFTKCKGTKIKKASHTRWLSHENAINSIRINYHSIIVDLENAVVTGQSRTTSGVSGPTAEGLLKHLKNFHFFQLIHFLCDVLSLLSKLVLIFERRDIDLSTIHSNVSITLGALKNLKRKPGGQFCRNLENAARKIGIQAPIAAENCKFEEDARCFLDLLVQNISERMHNIAILDHLSVLDMRHLNADKGVGFYGVAEMAQLADFYQLDEDLLLSEWEDFKSVFLQTEEENSDNERLSMVNVYKTLEKSEDTIGVAFPLIQKLVSVGCVLPLSTAEVERTFSQVKLILTDHRNRLKVENVNSILAIKLNGKVNYREAVKHWMKQQRRIFSCRPHTAGHRPHSTIRNTCTVDCEQQPRTTHIN